VGYSLGFVGLNGKLRLQGGLDQIISAKAWNRKKYWDGLVFVWLWPCAFAFAFKGWMMFAI